MNLLSFRSAKSDSIPLPGKAPLRRFSLLLVLALAACAAPRPVAPPPAPPPPPPPPPIVVPPKPTPPDGASSAFEVPPLDATGQRQSVNRAISPMQAVWNLRSAYNVGALYCKRPEHAALLERYRRFLKTNARVLDQANAAVTAEFVKRNGAGATVAREAYLTSVYNHYALPPTQDAFCDTLLNISSEGATVKPAKLRAFAVRVVPVIEMVFDDFFTRYDRYRADLADWETRYGALVASGRAVIGYPQADSLPTTIPGATEVPPPPVSSAPVASGYGPAPAPAGDSVAAWQLPPPPRHN